MNDMTAPIAGGRVPRPDQIEVATKAIQYLNESQHGQHGKIIEMPTGSGKTLSTMVIFRHLLDNNPDIKLSFMVHRRELFSQTLKEFINVFGADMIDVTAGDKHTKKIGARIRLYMEQTVISHFKKYKDYSLEKCDVMFIDEAHSMNYQSFLQKVFNAGTAVIGLSATPDDWRMLRFWHNEKILGASQEELEGLGVLVEPTFYTPEAIHQIALMIESGGSNSKQRITFDDALKYCVPEMKKVESEVGRPLRWIVKTQSKKQAREMAKWLNSNGFPSRAFWSGEGGGKQTLMDSIMDGTAPDHLRVAVVVQRFSVGYDHPGIEGIVLTGEMKYSLFVQTVGRALRPGFPRVKNEAYIVDLAGNLVKYLDKYVERRVSPSLYIPERVKRRMLEEERKSSKPKEIELIDYELILHEVKLSHIGKRSVDLDKACLMAYCAVLAEKEAGTGDDNAQARVKRTMANYWMLTKQPTGGRVKMRNAIMNCPESKTIWVKREPMPSTMLKELKEKRLAYSREKARNEFPWQRRAT